MSDATLLTGATGFIGRNLARALACSESETYAIVRSSASASHLPDAIRVLDAPATAWQLKAVLAPLRIGRVFHLATHFVGDHESEDLEALLSSNVLFGAQVAEAVANAKEPPIFINTGTAWQNGPDGSYQPAALYAATKQACEDILRFFALTRQLRVTNVRLFDTYGPGDRRKKLVELLVRAAISGEKVELSPGEQLINLTHVEDAVDALLSAAKLAANERDSFWMAWGVYGGETLTIRDLAEAVEHVTGRELDARWGARPYREREMFELWDAGPALPNWNPAIDIDQGIGDLINELS